MYISKTSVLSRKGVNINRDGEFRNVVTGSRVMYKASATEI